MVSWCRHTHFTFREPSQFLLRIEWHTTFRSIATRTASSIRRQHSVRLAYFVFTNSTRFPDAFLVFFFFFVIFLFAFRFILFSTAHKKVTAAESGKMYKIVMRNHVHVIRRHNCRTSRRFEGNTSGENEYAGDQHKSQFRTETLFRNNERVGGPWNISWPS